MFRGVGLLSLALLLLSSESARSAEQKFTLSVAPAGVGKPILKYRLLPDPRELRPGNAATIYYRTEAMFVENSVLLKDLQDAKWHEWNSMPLSELPLAEMEKGVRMARHFLRELEVAATYRDCDWQLGEREEGIALLIPDVQGFRMFASLLGARARLHIAQKNYPEALRTLRTGYTLGYHLGKGPTLIHCLVGIAIVSVMDRQLDTLIQQPDAPNLYWTFRTLPRPLFDPRPILLQESEWIERTWPLLKRLDKGVLTAREIQTGVAEIDKRIEEFNVRQPPFKNATRSAAIVALHAPARTWLIENGFDRALVEEMNPIQAVLLSHYKQFRLAYEEWLVWAVAGENEIHPAMKSARERANAAMGVLDRLFFANLLDGLSDGGIVPTVAKINETSLRVERRHVGLATIEALRAQATENGGKWPASLEEVKVLPVPVDPITRKPWDFQREGDWVTLTSPLAEGEKPTSTSHFIYRVELRGK